MILAAVAVILIIFESGRRRQVGYSKDLLGATVLALLFSFLCFVAADYNDTHDYSYATYFVSFFVWLGGAYTVCGIIRMLHGEATFKLLTYYLVGVCVVQCILAMMIDKMPAFQSFVDAYIFQGQDFLQDVNRLYGIGASLDPAGIRFGVVALMIAFVLFNEESIRSNKTIKTVMIFLFFVIAVMGNMVSRTTSVGVIMGLAYMLYRMNVIKTVIKKDILSMWGILLPVLAIAIVILVYLYNTDDHVYRLLRFAFEGFFNWVETGEWKTSSTDKLNNTMWIWPGDLKTWFIGTGLFGNFVFSTDIGYCRFILYCGLCGFSVFALFFLYNAFVIIQRLRTYRLFCIALCIFGFIIWLKVATDIFLIYALFYCMDRERRDTGEHLREETV
ncbi:MAG: hypothetical protein LBH19_11250 [Dysgonamonadaceae bacterium]|jgi:hypothetical protein|nr:hypothetical protein [Dysgonamonadaceae bacterium]